MPTIEEVEIDGTIYTVTTFESGTVIRQPKETPEQKAIIEAARLEEEERLNAKMVLFLQNMPSRAQVHTAIANIANLADAKAFLDKLADMVYWLAMNKEE